MFALAILSIKRGASNHEGALVMGRSRRRDRERNTVDVDLPLAEEVGRCWGFVYFDLMSTLRLDSPDPFLYAFNT